ncbi:MAG: FHA domain-containing protein [bacterium]|nr:FHA domain-containing protein [bacterium]
MQNKSLNLIISQIIIFLFFSRSVFAISKIERILKDHPVKFSFIIFGACGVFVGILLLLSYYKAVFSAIRHLVYPSFSFFKDKKEFERHIIPTGEIGDISLQNARLIVKEAEGKVKEFLMTPRKEFWIGRDEDNQLILDEVTASRRHARIRPQTDGYIIYDLHSKGGTFINGKLIQSHILKTGDEIGIAHININIIFKKQDEEIVKIEPEKEKKEKYLGPERRKYPRLDMKAAVNYLAYSPTGISKDEQAYTENIGGNGICITTADCITRSTIIELEIEIPGYSSPINALARVIYSRKRRMDNDFDTGLLFTDISDEERKYIIDYTNSKIAR